MFDVVAQTSVTIAALILGLQPYIDHASTQKHHVQVYYKEGTHNIGAFNLSEWLLLGRAVVNSTSAQEEAEVRLDALDPWGDTQVGANWTLCAAAPLCEGPTECDHIECRCRIADVEQNQTRNLVEKNRAYDYMLYTFCRGETYCGPRNDTASCICTQGARQDCRPAQQEVPAWLGPRESWVEDTESFRSSTYVTGVDLDKVLGQEPDGMWHSGNGSSDAAEHGCPHLPRCPPEWPYARGQWLAFDLGTHHALSRFRIRYPDFTLMPAYTFHGLSRTNIREEYWLEGHPRDFSFQFSRRSLDGPWITLLDGTAAKQAFAEGWQTFAFEPETARYWRFYIKNNYGFGYTALGGIELFGFQSRWQHLSNRCHWSLECSTGGVDRAVLVTDGAAAIRESGLVLAAGRHSLFLHTNLGLQVAEIDARRGEVVKSDGRLAITFGSAVEAMSPLFAFEDIGAVPGKTPPVEVSPQAVTVSSLLTHGFVLAARFVSGPAGNLSGVVLALGDPCKRGLTLWVLPEGGIRLRQGCTGGEEAVVESDELASVEPNSEYTMAITFSAQDGELSAVIQRLAPLTPGETVTVGPASLALEEPPFIGSILIGAASSCGKHAFSGAVRAASIYAGALNEASLAAVLRRRCRATAVDGSCVLDPERFVEEQQIETRGAMDADFLTLPVTSWCFRRWRLHVTASAGGGPASAPWCLRELVLFQSAAPQWVTLQTLSGTNASAGAVSVGYAAEAAFDSAANSSGKGEAGGETFCSAQSGAGPAWVEVDFEARECVAGYAILAPDDLSAGKVPGSWVLQGSDDGKVWTTVDSRAGEVWQDHEWKRFETPREARYLLFSSLFDETTEWGYNTFSDLHAFVSEAHGWQRVQRLETKGARKAVHFEADDTHFIALAESVDSTQTKGAMWNDGVSADSRVGSNVWAWSPDRRQFAVVDTLPTNNSASVEHFVMHGRDYLVLADHRRKLNEPGLPLDDTYHSLLLRRTVGLDECGHRVCLETDGCGCDSCACRTMLQGESTGGSGTMFQAAAALAFDGDHGTAWRGVATEGVDGGYTALVGNADSTLSTYLNVATADIPLALEFAFVACPSKARVVGYSMASPALSCPRVWQLQGSDDGATWVSLDTRTRADCPWAGVLSFYLPRDPPATPGDNNGGAYGVAEYKRFRLVFAVSGTDLEVEVLEVELLFEHSINQAYYTNERGATAIYDVQEMGPPFSSTARDDDGHPVARFWTSGYPHIGVLGPVFDVELSHGTRLTNASGCQLFPILQSDHRAVAARTTQNGSVLLSGADADSWHNPLAPFEQRAVCFSSTGDEVSGGGFCSAGLSPANQNLTCTSDSDCPPQSYCLPRRKYGYRVSFKRAVRLLSLSMSGCGWCNGSVLVTDVHLAPLARRDHSTVSDCTACNTWRLAVNATGVEFNIVEDNLAPFSLRTAITFEWEPHSDWKEVQLLPSTRAHDITYFTIDGVAHLAMANYYQGDEPCYGDVWCLNKRGTDPMDSAAAAQPHHINSSIFRHDGQQFVLHQEIATRGALDMEHFVISGRHFLAVANSFENVLSSSDTTSDIYVWDSASADGAGQFVLHQAIATQGARAAKHMVKDGRHLLLLSNTFDGAGARYGARPVLYRWGGSRFEAAGELPAVGVAGVSVTTIHGTQYLAVASYYNGSHFNTNSKLLRFADAFAWHGAVRYADNAAPSAHFLERRLGASSNVSNAISMINVSLRADRGLPVATRITIGGLEGSTTPSGALPLSGAAGTRFNSTARWDAESMQAVLTLAEAVPANDTLSLVFELRNNVTLQAAVQSWVETGGPVAFPRMSMHGEVLGVAEIADSAWNFVESRQAVTVRDAPHNQLEFELEAAVDIPSDSRIHITGLKGATSAVEHISLSGIGSVLFTSEDPMLARSIRWNNTDKSLTAIVGDGVAAFERFVFSLNLSNAWTLGGVHPNVSVTTADGVLIPATPSRSAVFLYKEVPGFTVATIEDSHRVLSGENEFTLRLQPNLPLMLGARISISGLAGSSDPDRVVPIGGPHKHRFKYHIAVFAAAEETLTLTVGANCRTSCLGGTCSTHDAPCLFPFTFERFPHWQCTQAGGAARPWCATSEEFAGSLDAVSPHWGFCVCEPSIPDDEVTTITFKLSNSNQRANDFAAPEISASAFVNIPERPLLTRAGSVAQVFGAESSSQALTLAANEQAVTSPLDGWRPLWEFSVELWCQTAAGASLQILTVEPEDGGLAFAFESGVLVLTVNGSSTTSDDALSDGEWHHLAATWKSATGEVLLYLDGVEAGSATGIAPGAALNVTGGELTLGDVSGATAMKLAQVRIWSLARSPSGVPSLADTSHVFLTGALPAGLIAYYNFAAAGTDISRVAGDLYPKDGTQGGVLVTEDLSYSTVALEGFVWPGADWRGSSAVSTEAYAGGDVCLNVSLASSVSIGPGAEIYLGNLGGLQEGARVVPVLQLPSDAPTALSWGLWEHDAARFSFALVKPLHTGETLHVRFTLIASLRAEEMPERELTIAAMDGAVESYGDSPEHGDKPEGPPPATVPGAVLLLHNLTDENALTCNGSVSVPWAVVVENSTDGDNSTENDNSLCPTFSSCTAEEAPPCSCVAACPVAAFKVNDVETNLSLLDLKSPLWQPGLLVAEESLDSFTRNISIQLQPDRTLPAGSLITIQGLTGSLPTCPRVSWPMRAHRILQLASLRVADRLGLLRSERVWIAGSETEDREASETCDATSACFIQLSGEHARSLNVSWARWEQLQGRLTLALSSDMPGNLPFHFSVVLGAPFLAQAVVPSIEVSGPVRVPPTLLCAEVLVLGQDARVLQAVVLAESTCSPCEMNNVTLALRPNVALPVGTRVTLSGLDGTLTPDQSGVAPVEGRDRYRVARGLAEWSAAAGQAVLELGVAVAAREDISLALLLHNGRFSQRARGVRARFSLPGEAAAAVEARAQMLLPAAGGGGVLSFQGRPSVLLTPEAVNGTATAQWMATQWRKTVEASGHVWVKSAVGACCVGACCAADSCCTCSHLKASGLAEYNVSGRYFRGSPCEMYCDQETDGGGWTLLATVTNAGSANRWTVDGQSASEDPTDWVRLYGTNYWEEAHYAFGQADPSVHQDFRSWAFMRAAGDGNGAGEQLMVTAAEQDEATQTLLLQTDGACLDGPLAGVLANLSWECNGSGATPLFDTLRPGSSVDSPVAASLPCAHACGVARSNRSRAEGALVGTSDVHQLYLKAGGTAAEDAVNQAGAETAANSSISDRVYLSTEWREHSGVREAGLGSTCDGDANEEAFGRSCGADVGGVDGSEVLRYSLWARSKTLWRGDCSPPLRRRGDACVCCTCPPGESHNGGQCVACPAGRYKATDADEPCKLCAGTDVLGEGQSECPHTLEIVVEVAEAWSVSRHRTFYDHPRDVAFSFKWNETGTWSETVVLPASTNTWGANLTGVVNTTLRFVGTPVALRYSLKHYTDLGVWRPASIAVRVNRGRWYEPQQDLCDLDSSCRPGDQCPSRTIATEGGLDCGFSAHTSGDVNLLPSVNISQIEDLLD